MVALWRELWQEDNGQDIAEYAVMLAVILVLVVGTIRLVGSNSNNAFSSVASSIQWPQISGLNRACCRESRFWGGASALVVLGHFLAYLSFVASQEIYPQRCAPTVNFGEESRAAAISPTSILPSGDGKLLPFGESAMNIMGLGTVHLRLTLRIMSDDDLWWLFLDHREECLQQFWEEVETRKVAGILSNDSPLWTMSDISWSNAICPGLLGGLTWPP